MDPICIVNFEHDERMKALVEKLMAANRLQAAAQTSSLGSVAGLSSLSKKRPSSGSHSDAWLSRRRHPSASANAIASMKKLSFATTNGAAPDPLVSHHHRQNSPSFSRSSGGGIQAPATSVASVLKAKHQLKNNNNHSELSERATTTTTRSGALYGVRAIHVGQAIDLEAVVQHVFPPIAVNDNDTNQVVKPKRVAKNSLVLELPPSPDQQQASSRYMAVFRFGSVVGLNVPPKEFQQYLTQIRKQYVADPVQAGHERREDFAVLVRPEVDAAAAAAMTTAGELDDTRPPVVTGDYCIVSALDLDGVAVISNIMAQTVALDTYNDTVDALLNKFAAINASVRASGTFQQSDKSLLFKSVAQNNAIFIDMISKMRIKDRSDTAWNVTKYEDIHYGLKAEFEIDNRYNHIEYKLNLIQQNSKFFLEVLNSEKSSSLEWTIVWLIGAECILMCIDMSGMGQTLFTYLGSFLPEQWPLFPPRVP